MTLEEATKHCEEVAEKKEYIAETLEGFDEYTREECLECASEHRQLAEWLKELKEYRSKDKNTRWIPVSERLPEKDVDVLAYHRNESFDYQYVSWIDDYSGKWAGFIGNLSDEVLAWMPLPENYKEGSK